MKKILYFFAFITICGCTRHQVIIQKPFGFKAEWQEGSLNSRQLEDGSIEVEFPPHKFGPNHAGFNWSAKLIPKEQYTISYEVKFSEDFDFVKGGKLPGLCGGHGDAGERPAGDDKFSARIMWRKKGKVVSYVYHLDQKDRYGDDFPWNDSFQKALFFVPGKWQKISFTVRLNNILKSDGAIVGNFDDQLAIEKLNLKFRTNESLKIDHLCFNTFFGGNDESWAPSSKQLLWIRHLKIE